MLLFLIEQTKAIDNYMKAGLSYFHKSSINPLPSKFKVYFYMLELMFRLNNK
jgi:hypothetical protein